MDVIQEKFEKFHSDNPHVYHKLVELARIVHDAGYQKYSIDALFNRLRWHYDFETKTTEKFKLCDHHRSRYSRLIMAQEPDLWDFFTIKPLRSQQEPEWLL